MKRFWEKILKDYLLIYCGIFTSVTLLNAYCDSFTVYTMMKAKPDKQPPI